MTKFVNRAKMSVSGTPGTGTITLASAVSGYQSFADAGVTDGDVVRYVIEDGTDWEIGTGTYTASGTTLSRTVLESSNADAAVNLTSAAQVFVAAVAEDMAFLDVAQTFSKAQGTTITPLTDAASIATDAEASNAFSVTLAGNRTLANPTNIVEGNTYIWYFTQDATGSRTLGYGSYFKFPNKTAPSLTTAANAVDRIVGFARSATDIDCNIELDFG